MKKQQREKFRAVSMIAPFFYQKVSKLKRKALTFDEQQIFIDF